MSKSNLEEWVKHGVVTNMLAKSQQYDSLESFGLLHPAHHHLTFENASPDNIDFIVENRSRFLVMAHPRVKGYHRKARFDVTSLELYRAFYEEVNNERPDFDFIEQVQGLSSSFVSVAMSDGEGNVLIECYKMPFFTNIHQFTSGMTESRFLSLFYFEDFDMLRMAKVGEMNPEMYHISRIRRRVECLRGYFEIIYGNAATSGDDYYFTEYQRSSIYFGALTTFKDMIPRQSMQLTALLCRDGHIIL